jgi:hypothetical protein
MLKGDIMATQSTYEMASTAGAFCNSDDHEESDECYVQPSAQDASDLRLAMLLVMTDKVRGCLQLLRRDGRRLGHRAAARKSDRSAAGALKSGLRREYQSNGGACRSL